MKFLKSYNWIDLLLNLTVLVIYLGLAKLGQAFAMTESSAIIFWPAGGFALAVLLLSGPKNIPGVFGGALAAALMIGDTLTISVLSALGNTLETVLAYWLLTYFRPINLSLEHFHDLLKLLLYGAIMSSLVSAIIGPLSLIVLQQVEPSLLPEIALRWWMGDVIGIALVTPLILLCHQSRQQLENKVGFELIVLLFLTLLMGQIVFYHWSVSLFQTDLSIAWLLPFIIWSGLRAGRRHTSILILIIYLQALWAASHGLGHYANELQESGLVNLWMFGQMIFVGGMLLAIMTAERKRVEQKIIESESFAKATIDASTSVICVLDKKGEILAVNQAWREFYDENALSSNTDDYFVGARYDMRGSDPDDGSELQKGILQVTRREIDVFNWEYPCHSPTEQRWFNAMVTRFNDDSGNIVIAHENITIRKQVELRENSRSHIIELIMDEESLSVTLDAIVRSVEQDNPAMLCSILLLDDAGKYLLSGAAPSLPDFYNKVIHGMKISADAGSCGSAAYTRERVIVDDIQTHPYWVHYKELASKAELAACWSEPIRSTQGNILGTFAIYHHDVHKPTEADIALIEQTASLASIAIEKAQAKLTLESSEERWAFALEGAGDGVWDWDISTNKTIYSKRWKEMLGYDEDDIIPTNQEWVDRIYPEDRELVSGTMQAYLEGNQPIYVVTYRLRCKDGSYKWILGRGMVVKRDSDNKPLRMVGTHTDITELKKTEEKLKLAASVFTHAREGIIITDARGSIIDVNDTFTDVTGYGREEAIGHNPRILQSGRQVPEFYVDMWQALQEDGYWSGEVWNRRKNGEVYAEMLNISSVRDARGQISNYVALFTDITLMKEHQGELERNAHYDLLTNLPNRVLLADRLSQAMLQCRRHKQSLAVVFLDLDGFKAVNDTHGHDVGDELLIVLSVRMKEALREGDTLARFGGDEFVAVLADLAKVEDCEPVLERFLLAASEPVTIGDIVINVSASIGVTLYPQDSADTDQLMRHADQAMYVAKESGKNRYHIFDTAQDDVVKLQRESLEAIRIALDEHQFVLHYQPKVNMRTGLVTGVEALIRWQHPKRGLLNPLEFLPVIENHPMSIDMGEWVLDTVLTQIGLWQKMGINLSVSTSVNIAAVQLQQTDFTERLTTLLAAHPNVEPRYLELEVLETSALDDVAHVSTIMNDCMALGINFALDDFGTGYSSLTYLRRLPASLIKIDQSFVRDMLTDPDDLAIVEGVIALAKSFKRDVIAEGVETIEHGAALLQLGCELAQGYGIAKPMPANDIPAWVNEWKPDDTWKV